MTLINSTRNQHFVSQAEQRLNSINPSAKVSNQRIYAFSLVDRDLSTIRLASQRGTKISNTLNVSDLFSFDVVDRANRHNFEQLFQRYEADITLYTRRFIEKVARREPDVKDEVVHIFLLKLLNSFRSPYSIVKTLNTFPSILKNGHPTDSMLYKEYSRVVSGNKPHQEALCRRLGITRDQYHDWLRSLFILLSNIDDDTFTLFDKVVASLFNDGNLRITIRLCTYSEKTCLLSDNGFVAWTDQPHHMVMAFNLYSHGFVQYAFLSIDSFIDERIGAIPQRFREAVERFKAEPKEVTIDNEEDNLESLHTYNRNAVLQCHSHVYNATKECYGVDVV